MSPVPREIKLTATEERLKRLLLDVAAYIDANPTSASVDAQLQIPSELNSSKVELRFAGGWVRDKLLGVGSVDIDVAINNMTGEQFALRMKEYMDIPGNAEKYNLEGIGTSDDAGMTQQSKFVGGLHKIKVNPEKSKNLETITTKIFGLDIDLVNLRKETYTEESRNPQMEFGTPEEDALRRDATINALFYNLNISTVEDFTEHGLKDMELKIIRTPLEPYQTFKDDPLRVLRLIRFSSRLGYTIDPQTEEAMANEDIKTALKLKITRERVGVELEKMLRGPDPYGALSLIDRLGLYEVIFTDPTPEEITISPETTRFSEAYAVAQGLNRPREPSGPPKGFGPLTTISSILVRDKEDSYLTWVLSALVPWADAPRQNLKPGKLAPPFAVVAAREGFKAPNKVCDVISSAINNLEEIRDLKDRTSKIELTYGNEYDQERVGRDVLGMAVRRWGPTWRNQVTFALIYELTTPADLVTEGFEERTYKGYASFLARIKDLDLLEAYNFKHLVDGKQLASALGIPPGPWMKKTLDLVMSWQLAHPEVTDPAAVLEEMKAQRDSGSLNLNVPPTKEKKDGQKEKGAKKGELAPYLALKLLHLTVRPAFQKSGLRSEITKHGRLDKRRKPGIRKYEGIMEDETEKKPWKSTENRYILSILDWSLHVLSPAELDEAWPLLVPPILNILDDHDPVYKARGAVFLNLLLNMTPPSLLTRTGLGEVFADALIPLFTYLPSLTPESQSIEVLNAAFPALLTLSRLRYPRTIAKFLDTTNKDREKFLHVIMRRGILSPHAHCRDNVRIAETLLDNLPPLLQEMGILSVKHLKSTLPILSTTLADPLGPAYPPLLISAARALKSVIMNAWPRIPQYKTPVLKGPVLCWLRCQEERNEGKVLEDVERELKEVMEVFGEAMRKDKKFPAEVAELVQADTRLGGLAGKEVPFRTGVGAGKEGGRSEDVVEV
ncbi:poly A polymerase C-terminal region-like protein [Patellaria atrata CBS 101060]|uniref:Poly A polymerase C-terminal region-like protein n=1 Tax=Patellaria atrata CBS 101060 TaxID=1346257 RepID=A0A9P4VSP0_9PEZI|nr:poly A polymerase C-terminal region-like protein [Patellaria atrata CBS 101060]